MNCCCCCCCCCGLNRFLDASSHFFCFRKKIFFSPPLFVLFNNIESQQMIRSDKRKDLKDRLVCFLVCIKLLIV